MAKQKKFGVREFFKAFPDDDACLDHILADGAASEHQLKRTLGG